MKNKRILAGAFGWFRAACLPQPAFLALTGWGEFPRLEKQQIDNR
jgi:hypothetical protein